ncbi:MAG TPA: class I SAM-dependent methyltransferase [Candidatus Andersenbacteria bacterium]|nr:class I SAM-dependent methyltransferase [Candidatus Andersenbacteria bacterium]
MIAIQKFDPQNFDRSRVWNNRYREMYSALNNFSQYENQSFWPVLQAQLKSHGQYLDAGCGIGGWILFLSDRGYHVQGIDAHPQAVRAMTEYDPDLSVKIASSDAIPVMDATLDGVLSIGSLEYAEGAVDQSLAEFYRVLKQDGLVCIEVPVANVLRKLFYIPLKRLEGFFMSMAGRKATFAYYLFSRSEIESMLKQKGFVIDTILSHDLPEANSHFGLYSNWPFLRGNKPYTLNAFGRIVKSLCNAISPWVASAGMVVIAKKV